MQQSKKEQGSDIIIYTDGSCLRNPGPGGCAYIILHNNQEISNAEFFRDTTNNRMELSAVIMALEALESLQIDKFSKIILYSDSTYVVNGLTKWIYNWIKKNWHEVKNPDLWQKLVLLKTRFLNIKFMWIKAHNGDYYNEKVDQLAKNIVNSNYFR